METKLLSDHAEDLLEAAELLRNGAVVGMPTETVYGLAADARNPDWQCGRSLRQKADRQTIR